MSRLATERHNVEIGQRLAAVRLSVGLTQFEFAATLDLSPRAYANYERGEREMPAAVLKALRTAHQIDSEWLLHGPGLVPERSAEKRIDAELLVRIIAIVEDGLTLARKTLKAEKKARVIELAYKYCAATGRIEESRIRELLLVA